MCHSMMGLTRCYKTAVFYILFQLMVISVTVTVNLNHNAAVYIFCCTT